MASLAVLMLGWGALGLTIESDSPDAHCPPVTEVRDAVAARVGDVQGDASDVHYGLVRDAQTGRSFVSLVVRNEDGAEVLQRDIPLTEGNCSDVSLAIAVVLERYFAGVIRPPAAEPSEETDSTESEVAPQEVSPGDTPPNDERPSEAAIETTSAEEPSLRPLLLRGAAGVGTGPQPTFHFAVGWQLTRSTMLFSEVTLWPITTEPDSPSFQERSAWSGLQAGIELATPFGRALQVAAAPYVGLALQQARAFGPVPNSVTGRRVVPTLGTALRIGLLLDQNMSLGALLHGTALMGGARFVVEYDGSSREVLDLPAGRGDAAVYFSHRF